MKNDEKNAEPENAPEDRLNDEDKQLDILEPDQEEKVCFIVELYGLAYTKRAIILAFRKKYGLSLPQTYRYLNMAHYRMEEELETDRNKVLAQAKNRLKTTIRKAKEQGDFKAALAAEMYYDKLMGLHNPYTETPLLNNGGDNAVPTAPGESPEIDPRTLTTLAEFIARAAAENGGFEPPALDAPQNQAG